MPRRAASYLRVSTDSQAKTERHGLQRQQDDIAKFAPQYDLEVAQTYQDLISGKTVTRQGFEALKSDLGNYEAVVISSVDRLARDMSGSFRLLSELLELGVEVYSTDIGLIDFSEDMSLVHFSVKSMFAHLEHSGIRRKTQSARIAMAEKGRNPSGTRAYGLMSSHGHMMLHPEEAPHMRRIFVMSAEGNPINEITRRVNAAGILSKNGMPWQPATIARCLRNPIYKGEAAWKGYKIDVPALVDEALWQAAQRPNRGAPDKLGWLLTRHIRCGRCGKRMNAHRGSNGRGAVTYRYRCSGGRKEAGLGRPCGCGAVLGRKRIERRVTEALALLFEDDEILKALLSSNYQGDEELGKGLRAIDQEDKEAFEAKLRGVISFDELEQIRSDLTRRRNSLYELHGPKTYPLAMFREVAQGLSPREILEEFSIVAIATSETLDLSIE